MSYIKAEDILPEEVIELVQQYVDGETIYIPRKTENRLAWGCRTGYKSELRRRNAGIRRDHAQGVSIAQLAERYHLAPKSIRRILKQQI